LDRMRSGAGRCACRIELAAALRNSAPARIIFHVDVVTAASHESTSPRASNRATRSWPVTNASDRILIATALPQLRIASAIHLAHAAFTEQHEDFVGAEAGAHRDRHFPLPPSTVLLPIVCVAPTGSAD